MSKLTIAEVRNNGWIVLEAISGSRSFNLDDETSDMDIHGVFLIPLEHRHRYLEQKTNSFTLPHSIVEDNGNTMFWEFGHFVSMLSKGSPLAMELLFCHPASILYRKEDIMDILPKSEYLTERYLAALINFSRKLFGEASYTPVSKLPEKSEGFACATPVTSPLQYFQRIDNQVDLYHWLRVGKGQGEYILVSRGQEDYPEHLLCKVPSWKSWMGTPIAGTLDIESKEFPSVYRKKPFGCKTICPLAFNHAKFKADQDIKEAVAKVESSCEKGYNPKVMSHAFRVLHMAYDLINNRRVQVFRTEDSAFLKKVKSGKFTISELQKMFTEKSNGISFLREECGKTLGENAPEFMPLLTKALDLSDKVTPPTQDNLVESIVRLECLKENLSHVTEDTTWLPGGLTTVYQEVDMILDILKGHGIPCQQEALTFTEERTPIDSIFRAMYKVPEYLVKDTKVMSNNGNSCCGLHIPDKEVYLIRRVVFDASKDRFIQEVGYITPYFYEAYKTEFLYAGAGPTLIGKDTYLDNQQKYEAYSKGTSHLLVTPRLFSGDMHIPGKTLTNTESTL